LVRIPSLLYDARYARRAKDGAVRPAGATTTLPKQGAEVHRVKVYTWSEIPTVEVKPGAKGKNIDGEKASVSLFEMAPGAEGDPHSHENEQINYVLEGGLEFSSGAEVKVLKAGQVVVFPPNASHRVRNISKATARHIGFLIPARQGGLKKK
jgi:quercetin dioxygenase-like cupin family protein